MTNTAEKTAAYNELRDLLAPYDDAAEADMDNQLGVVIDVDGIRFVRTCIAVGETHEAYLDGVEKPIGYVRLRHDAFTVTTLDDRGAIVERVLRIEGVTGEPYFGMFDTLDQRMQHLTLAAEAINARI